MTELIHDDTAPLDPLGDGDDESEQGAKRNFAKVGSERPSALLYTHGPGAVVDLPQFTVMPAGLDDWEPIWARRDGIPEIHAPRLRDVVRMTLRSRNLRLRPFPWQPSKISMSREGDDLGVPARVFPQWLRCTGCDLLAPLSYFDYRNTHPYRPDEACFEHERCTGKPDRAGRRARSGGRKSEARKPRRRTAVAARYLLACVDGHLDEFPFDWWVHHGQSCAKAEFPVLRLTDSTAGKGASATVACESCGQRRRMNEAQGDVGRIKLPRCRGRHPHLDAFEPGGCINQAQLMLVGSSDLWFAATQSAIVMPEEHGDRRADLAEEIRLVLGERLARYADDLVAVRDLLHERVDLDGVDDEELRAVVDAALAPPPSVDEQDRQAQDWDPVDLLVPEWRYLLRDPLGDRHEDEASGLTLSRRDRDPALRVEITRVLAVERLRKVNALLGFTRVDAVDRVEDVRDRLVPLARTDHPGWTVATEDRGEGVFLQLDEELVAAWEKRVVGTPVWAAHRDAHRRNFRNRYSETAADVDPDDRLRPPRYWLIHSLAHILIREMALTCGYSAASLSERLYAWEGSSTRPAAAGLLICTTASDSDGTLGGLVQLSEPERLQRVVSGALFRAGRCSSDPVCAHRTPKDPEDFLHGAACHACAMASETSCERANRFLDRRFLIDLPDSDLGFFGRVDG